MKSITLNILVLGFLGIAVITGSAYAITPSIGEIKDSRTTGQFFAGLDLELNLVGDDLADVKGIRTTLSSAVDATGRNLIDPEKMKDEFEAFNTSSWQKNSVTLSLKNPARKADTIKEIKGELQFFMPTKDPGATVKVANLKTQTGKPIQAASLKSAGIEITVFSKADYEKQQAKKKEEAKAEAAKQGMGNMFDGMFDSFMSVGENDLAFEIKDPNNKVVSYEVVDASGKPIENHGSMSSGGTKVINYAEPLPNDASLLVYVMTPGSIQTAKLAFESIALP